MITVFLVDDHEIVRRGLAELLEAQPDMTVVGEAGTCRDAVARIRATPPAIAILDVQLPDGSGIDVCRQIRQEFPETRCLMLTAYDDDDAIFAAILADASGCLLKAVRGDELVRSARAVAAGRRMLHPTATRVALQLMRDAPRADPRFGSLHARQRQILELIADGLTNRQIARRLGMAEKTVTNEVSSILAGLGLEHRTRGAGYAVEGGRPPIVPDRPG
ncbi:response regulator transcription factor [Microbacterium sp.]|uniref:response regulator transcription factor n=1 Tax=Microbacterium sp. TaxID=51671 RepID=UPI002B48FF41|nr:response regulator transcription factor [Microbacterium sp.]